MTTAVERTRALLWGGAFLIELAHDKTVPLSIRRQAVVIARHFPGIEEVNSIAESLRGQSFAVQMALAEELPPDTDIGKYGPLKWSTRLGWPE